MKCFYHGDLDGEASAAIVRVATGADCIRAEYGKDIPYEQIAQDERVWIVDFSLGQQPQGWERLLAITGDVVWIDHHKTAIEAARDTKIAGLDGVRTSTAAACVLTWEYLHPVATIPRGIVLIGDRDTWAWKHGDDTRYFFAGAQAHDTRPHSDFWPGLLGDHVLANAAVDAVMAEGEIVEGYRDNFYRAYREHLAFDAVFEGHKCWAMNVAHVGSEAFGSVKGAMPDGYDILMPFYFDGKQFTVSLYAETVDVGEIAKRHGGGGHKGAAGFQCEHLPFDDVACATESETPA